MSDFPLTLLFTMAALVLVLVLAWFAIKLLARLSQGKAGSAGMRITSTLQLGSRERLMIVEHDDREYVLGVTPTSISLIDSRTRKTDSSEPVS